MKELVIGHEDIYEVDEVDEVVDIEYFKFRGVL